MAIIAILISLLLRTAAASKTETKTESNPEYIYNRIYQTKQDIGNFPTGEYRKVETMQTEGKTMQDGTKTMQVVVDNTEIRGECIDWMKAAGITDIPTAIILINRESGCNPFATNGTSAAYGIPQSLPGNKMASMGEDWQTNPVTQLRWMERYVIGKYTTWENALLHSYNFGWY